MENKIEQEMTDTEFLLNAIVRKSESSNDLLNGILASAECIENTFDAETKPVVRISVEFIKSTVKAMLKINNADIEQANNNKIN